MKQTRVIMGMDVVIEMVDRGVKDEVFDAAFNYLVHVDEKFSTYKDTSEISRINNGLIKAGSYSAEMKTVFELSEKTKKESNGYFNIINKIGNYDPSGLVKGWAIYNVAKLLKFHGCKNFLIDIGNDIQTYGHNEDNLPWVVGIRNPFKPMEIVEVLHLTDMGIATSAKYARGEHIYNPHDGNDALDEIVSMTIIGPNIYEADRFATPAFAMGKAGIYFIEKLEGFEGYMIDKNGVATMTSGFNQYIKTDD